MTLLLYAIVYLSIVVFIGAVVRRIMQYLNNPIHIRWELYPVAHEGKRAEWGGSYLEDVDWWQKPREFSRIGELKVMIPEILFLKAVWEHNRPLWYVTYPFHLGLYCLVAFLGLLGIGGIFTAFGAVDLNASGILSPIAALTNLLGPLGFVLVIGGAVGLIYKRKTDKKLKNYSTPEHFFNLALFIATMSAALLSWLFADPTFQMARTFIANLMTFHLAATGSFWFNLSVLLGALTIAYIPLTHMAHFFMKYFLYHDIRWGDKPNIDSPETDAKIGVVLNYPVTWSAPHIAGHGRETWAEVATFNPAAEPLQEKEAN